MSDLSSELANFEAELGGDDFDVDAILSSTASSFQAPVAPANTSSYGPVKTPQTSASNPSPYARPTTASSAVPIKSSSVSISAPAVITAAPVVISAQPSIASSSSVISASPAVVSAPAYVTAAPAVLTASGVLPPMPPPPHLLAAGAPTYIPPHQIHSQYAVDAAALAAAAAVRAASASASASSPTAGSGAGGDEEEEKKKHLRKAAGKVWEDSTLDAWPENDVRLFVGNLGNEVSDNLLSEFFSKYPSFVKARVVRDKRSGKSKGFGFASFLEPDDAMKAFRDNHGKYLGNRPCSIRKSTWKDREIENKPHRKK